MPVLAAATLELNADGAKFQQDLGRAVQQAATLGTAIGQVLGDAIGKGVSKLVSMVEHSAETGEALNKLSQRTGMTVENLSELRGAAALADVSMQTLKSSVSGLYEKMSQAGRVDGKSRSAFEAIGLDVEKLRALKPDEIFKTVTERLSQYEEGANRATLQTAIFGASGKELTPFITELGKTTELAKQLGLTMSKDQAEASERFKDNLTVSRLASEAMGQRITQVLLPSLEKLSEFLIANAKNTDRLDTAARAADAGLKIIATAAAVVGTAFQITGSQLARMAAVFGAVVNGDFKGAATLAKDTFTDVGTALGETAGQIVTIWEETGNKVHAGAEKNGKKLAAPAIEAVERIKKARKEADVEFQAFLKIKAIEDEAAALTQDFYRKQGQRIEQLNTARIEGTSKAWEGYTESLQKAKQAFAEGTLGEEENLATRVEAVATQVKKTDDFAKQMGLTFSSAFEKAVAGGSKLSDILKGLEQDIIQIITRKLITEPLGNALTGALSGMMSNGGALSGVSDFFGGIFRASGGPVEAGSPYIVGERGPELFVPQSSGGIVPNAALAGAMGAQQTTHIHFHGVTDASSFRANRAQISADISSALASSRRSF